MVLHPAAAVLGRLVVLVLAAFVFISPAGFAATVFVKASATLGNDDGSSWFDAYLSLDTAITNANADDELWVAADTYVPSSTTTGFLISKRLKLYGGFRGNEGSLAARTGLFSITYLDGFNGSTNSEHVLSVSGVSGASSGFPGVILDGFHIRNGVGTFTAVSGGGVYSIDSDLRIANCFVRDNIALHGGGVYFASSTSTAYLLEIETSEFMDNRADFDGGAVHARRAYGEVVGVLFLSNDTSRHGGGAYTENINSGTILEFTNCVFWDNEVTDEGGGVRVGSGGRTRLVNCSFNQNVANATTTAGGAVSTSTSGSPVLEIFNSVLWGDMPVEYSGNTASYTVEYSDVQGGAPGTGPGNINTDPFYLNPGLGRLGLSPPGGSLGTSPCIDAADYGRLPNDTFDLDGDSSTTEDLPLDVGGLARATDTSVTNSGVDSTSVTSIDYLDMGAYEVQ